MPASAPNDAGSLTNLECHIHPPNRCAGFPTTACLVGHPPMFEVTATGTQSASGLALM